MRLTLKTTIIFFLFSSSSWAAFQNWGESALVNSLGGEGVALGCEAASLSYNPAGLGLLKKGLVESGYSQLFNLKDLETSDLYLVLPWRRLTYGMGIFIFGQREYYKETIFACGFAWQIKTPLFAGMNLKYMKVGFGSKYDDLSSVGLDGGVLLVPNRKVQFGLALRNFNQPKLVDSSKDIPFSWAAGTTINPFENFKLSFNLSGEETYSARVHLGQEIKVFPKLVLRMGMASQPIRYGLGVGLGLNRFSLDYSFLEHPVLGETHRFNLSLVWRN
jgi:hypothetical protein